MTDRLSSHAYVLAFVVALDMLAVSLVVPLLPARYKELGVEPVYRGLVGSIYSASQLCGGLVMGFVGDHLEDRRSVLLLSFAGAAISYAMVGFATSVWLLAASRVVVGLVKQTMTSSKAMTLQWSSDRTRARAIGLTSSAATFGWVAGSSVTGILRGLSPSAPSAVAVSLYAVCASLVLSFLPLTPPRPGSGGSGGGSGGGSSGGSSGHSATSATKPAAARGFRDKARRVFGSSAIGRLLALKVGYGLIARAASSLQASWEMDRFGLGVSRLGYLTTAKALGTAAFSALVAGRAVAAVGEASAFRASLCLAAAAAVLEMAFADVWAYALVCVPLKLGAGQLAGLALESLLARIVPKAELGASLAVLDVLQSGCGVLAPLLGGAAMQYGGLQALPALAAAGYACLLLLSFAALPAASSVVDAAAGSANGAGGEVKKER